MLIKKIIQQYIFENTPNITNINEIDNIETFDVDDGKFYFMYSFMYIDEIRDYDWFIPYDLFLIRLRKEKIKCILKEI